MCSLSENLRPICPAASQVFVLKERDFGRVLPQFLPWPNSLHSICGGTFSRAADFAQSERLAQRLAGAALLVNNFREGW